MKHCFDLNLPINPLREDVDIMSYVSSLDPSNWNEYRVKIPLTDLNPELISVIQKLNLRVLLAEHFYTPPNTFSPIHTDLGGGDYTKLNYIFGGKNSTMQWYEAKNKATQDKEISIKLYELANVDLVESQPIGFPTIVQVGTPHNVQNYDEPRHCISVVLKNKNNQRLTMQESIDIFQQYIK